nr:MAG TPA: hypothetical protein [Caudoviricetes sp.]
MDKARLKVLLIERIVMVIVVGLIYINWEDTK